MDPFSYPVWIPWVLYALILVVVLVAITIGVLFFKDPSTSAKLPTITTISGLFVICISLTLIPIDIFTVSQVEDPGQHGFIIRILYYASFLTLVLFGFFLCPFAYFFYEEEDDDQPLRWRIIGALKYTVFTVILGALVVVVSLVLAFGFGWDVKDTSGWIKYIVDADNYGTRAIGFVVAGLTFIGLLFWNVYVAYGLAALPIGLIKSFTAIRANMQEKLEEQVDLTNEKIRLLSAKYELSGKSWSRRDKKEMKRLKGKRHLHEKKLKRIEIAKKSLSVRLQPFLYPLKLVLGLVILAMTIFLFASLFISLLDRIMFSECGFWCGYILDKPQLSKYNPFDLLLTYSSLVFPADYIVFALFLILVLLAAVTGLANIGIRLLFFNLYKIRMRNTVPQGLLTACVFLMFIIVVFSFSVISFAPQYATFGSQQYMNTAGELVACDYGAMGNGTWSPAHSGVTPLDDQETPPGYIGRPCFMTQIALIANTVALRAPFFNIAFFFENFVFIACYLLSLFVALIRKPFSFSAETASGDDEDDSDYDLDFDPERSYTKLSFRERYEQRRRARESARRSIRHDRAFSIDDYQSVN